MSNVTITGELYWAKHAWKTDNFGDVCEVKVKVSEEYMNAKLEKNPMLKNGFREDVDNNQVGGGFFFHAKQKGQTYDGEPKDLPMFVDVNNNEWDDDVLIGNGSKGSVMIECYKAKRAPKPSMNLLKVKVSELVEFGGSSEPIDVTDDLMEDELA